MTWFTRSFRALLWRNFIYRKRRVLPSLIEFFLPALCVAALYFIKLDLQSDPNSSLKSTIVPASYPGPDDAIIPLSFQDYVTALQADRVCIINPNVDDDPLRKILGLAPLVISGIDYPRDWPNNDALDWPVPFVFCNSYACGERGEDATGYCTYRTLALAPMNADAAGEVRRMLRFKDYVEGTYPQLLLDGALPFEHDFIQVFDSNDELQSYVTSESYGNWKDGRYFPKVAIGVIFSGGGGGGDDDNESTGNNKKTYEYIIRTNSTNFNSQEQSAQPAARTTPSTDRAFDPYKRKDDDSCWNPGAPNMGRHGGSCTGQYILNGAVTIQRLIDDWILSDSGVVDATVAHNGAVFLPFPSKEYTRSGFYGTIGPFAPLLFTLGLLYPVSSTIRSLVLEKELRQKELMKMLSVTECDVGWSWFVSFYAFFAPSSAITAVFTNLLYSSSNFAWLFVFWQLSFIACIVYCFLISSISSRATRATLIGIMLFFVGYFLPFVVDYQDGSPALITLLSLHPVTAYTYGLIMMGYLEDSGVGVQTTTVTASEFPTGYTFASSLSMLLFDSILWGIASWYLNRVLVGDYGTSRKWYFPLQRQYWCPSGVVLQEQQQQPSTTPGNADIPVESISETMKKQQRSRKNLSVHIHGLRKQFGEKTAVDGLDLSMYSGQITALLGHNGAGKTTTIGMLTGMVPPSSGYATVAGYDIRTDLSLLRENVGVCLQHDCLFPQLNVLEHVIFFSRVKGLYVNKSKEECQKSVMAAIEDVALLEKRYTFAKDLSGGMKRKLSVAIAFCGDSKVVFLDEPTSGMDPFSRRFTWNVIRQYRENRCIVLTTHFMDEADLLGDRIAIMSKGQLRCAGSPLFLKKHYGVGYQLTIIKKSAKVNAVQAEVEKEEGDGSDDLVKHAPAENEVALVLDGTMEEIVKIAVPSATVLSDVGTEISFQLPIGESAKFIGMFQKLEGMKKLDQIETYGVSVTTLDEVFLMVARGEEGLHLSSGQKEATILDEDSNEAEPRSYRDSLDATGQGTFQRHVQALFAKRAKNFKRDKKAWCCSTIIPTLTTLFGFLIVNIISRRNPNSPSLTLSLDHNNPEISVDRNPIPFNNPGVYDCQPGKCVYRGSTTNVAETNELYYFCGANAQVDTGNKRSATTCTIEDSAKIINQISQYGAFGVGNDVSDVLNSTISVFEASHDFDASLYGSIFFTHDQGSVTSSGSTVDETVIESCAKNPGIYTNVDQCVNYGGIGYIVNYNFTSLHSSLLYQATADEAIMRYYLDDTAYQISASVWPLPLTQVEEQYRLASNSFAAWFLLVLSFPFIAGSFATFIVAERESKAKHLQTVAGVQPKAYWLSTYFWDIMNYQIPLWTVIILMYLLDIQSFITKERQAASGTFAILILFGPAAAGFTYIMCFLFKSPSLANLIVIVFNFFIGMAGPLVCLILRLLAVDPANPKPNLKNAAIVVEWILRFIPSFCLGKGLLFTINIDFFEFIEAEPLTVWSPTIALYEIIFLGIESIAYILLTIQIDVLSTKPKTVVLFKKFTDFMTLKGLCRGSKQDIEANLPAENDDEDVLAEKDRVQSGQASDDLIVLNELSKIYPNGKRAVDHLSLGIPPGQCFGLLGINGAGKTSTMAMLTAEFPPSGGDAMLAGFSVSSEPEQTRRRIGYCPQFDAHFANMTGWEHIELYAVIKGVPRGLLKEVVASKLNEVGLSEFDGKRLSSGYSGGMKRKLSVACATIGAPQIVFLDEPSTGMDPVARRDLWKVISRMVTGKRNMLESEKTSVVLTTHSMEECEALCPRIGIMAGGKLRCLGSAQHLKSQFGTGFQIETKVKHPVDADVDVLNATRQVLELLDLLREDLEAVDLQALAFDTKMSLDQVKEACERLSEDGYLIKTITADDPIGYHIFKLAHSLVGITVVELVGFCVEELRMKAVIDFFEGQYQSAILRERQDVKVRFEVSSDETTLASIFANIEAHKEELMMDDYGVSQTSLEQVFNTFAAIAEKEKENTVDGK